MRTQTENLKVLVLAYLEANCRGRKAGVSKTRLALALLVPLAQEKRLREAIDSLADDHRIGSSAEHGYFVCESEEDFAVAERTMAGYAFPSMRRKEAIHRQRLAWRREQMGVRETQQTSLFEGVAG